MKIIERIVNFYFDHSREIEKTNGLAYAITVFYGSGLIFIFLGFLNFVLNIDIALPKTLYYVFLLLVTFSFYTVYSGKKKTKNNTWPKRKMTINMFVLIFSLFIFQEVFSSILIGFIEPLFYSDSDIIPGTVEDIGVTPEMMLFAIVLGPIVEELVFRGIALSHFKKTDNKFEAIIFTSVIFGLAHANLFQLICATLAGLIFGYIAVEFGVKYSILLHILGNGISYLMYFFNISYLLCSIAALTLFWCVHNWKDIKKKLILFINSETVFSKKRLFIYFLNPCLFAFYILWIVSIINSL